jgi:hypothetical protein
LRTAHAPRRVTDVDPYDVRTLLLVLSDIREDVSEIRKVLQEDDGEEAEEDS